MKPQMYDELVSALRNNADHYGFVGNNGLVHLLTNAADAIENLICEVADAHNAKLDAEDKLRWIPVTELPPEGETYGDTTFSVEVLGTEGFTYRKAYYNYRYKVWIDGNEEQEWPSITHWMPLPEPPKEET